LGKLAYAPCLTMAPFTYLLVATSTSFLMAPVLSQRLVLEDLDFDSADVPDHLNLLQIESQKSRLSRIDTRWPEWPVKGVDMPAVIEKMTYTVNRPIKMLQWTNWAFLDVSSIAGMDNCSLAGDVPNDPDGVVRDPDFDLSDIDVVLFHIPNLVYHWPNYFSMPRRKREGQLWYAMCGEPMSRPASGIDCHLAFNETFMADIDGFIGFQLSSDIPAIQDPVAEEMLRMPIPNFAERGPELVTVAISDCNSKTRQAWMQGIFDAFEARGRPDAMLSYGRCLHNAEEPPCSNSNPQRNRWMNPCASRAFKLVAENVQESWYVTEKVWDALGEGTIPVYWGPKEVKLFVPPDSIVFAGDFDSEDALVEHLLSFSDADFERAWAWKSRPVTEWGGYNKAWRLSHETLLPRVCEAASKILLGESPGGSHLPFSAQ